MWQSVSSWLDGSGRHVTLCSLGQQDGAERMTHGAEAADRHDEPQMADREDEREMTNPTKRS